MKFLGILRASALFILVSAFHGQPISCGILNRILSSKKSSTVEVSEISENPKESLPSSQSDLVFESSMWDDSQLASAVLFLEEFCEASTVKRFSGVFSEKDFEKLSYICGNISFTLLSITDHFTPKYCPGIVGGKEIDMNMYEDILKPEEMDVYADWLVKNIPQIKKSMVNMHSQGMPLTSEQAKTDTEVGPLRYGFVRKNFGWRSMSVRWLSGSTIAPNLVISLDELKNFMNKFLKEPKKVTVESQEYVPSSQSDVVSENIKDSTVESQEYVPSSQSDVAFENPEWHDSQLASTVLFLEEFCRNIEKEQFKEQVPPKYQGALLLLCRRGSQNLESFIQTFTPTYGPGTVAKRNEIPMNMYEGKLKPEQFGVYAKWIVKNAVDIGLSMTNMINNSMSLSRKELSTDTSVGPSKYGFVFVGDRWKFGVYYYLRDVTLTLSFFLKGLKSSLDDILGNSITRKFLSFFSRGKKSDVNSQQDGSTVKSQAV